MSSRVFEHKGRFAKITGMLTTCTVDADGQEHYDTEQVDDLPVLTIVGAKQLWRIFRSVQGKSLEVVFKVFRAQRSVAQNRWIWGVAVPTVRAWFKDLS